MILFYHQSGKTPSRCFSFPLFLYKSFFKLGITVHDENFLSIENVFSLFCFFFASLVTINKSNCANCRAVIQEEIVNTRH